MNNSRTQYLVSALVLVIALVVMQFLVFPMVDQNGALETQRTQLSDENTQMVAKIAELQRVQDSLSSVTDVEKMQLLSSVPLQMQQDQLLLDLNRLALSHNMTLQNVSFSPQSAATGVKTVSMNANFVGTYASLTDFLKALEENSRKVVVKTLSVQVGTSEKGAETVNFSLQLEAFYQS